MSGERVNNLEDNTNEKYAERKNDLNGKTLGSGRYIEGKNTSEEKSNMKDKSTLHRKYAKWMLKMLCREDVLKNKQ